MKIPAEQVKKAGAEAAKVTETEVRVVGNIS